MPTTGNPTSERSSDAVAGQAGATEAADAWLHVVGGEPLDLLQGANVARRRLEPTHESGEAYVALTQRERGPIFVNPLQVKYLLQRHEDNNGREPRAANARIHFADGGSIEVLQGSGIANKRLNEARASLSLFATFSDPTGNQVFVNCATVTHLAPDHGPQNEPVPERGSTRTSTT